jgi:hypothetical protein
MIISARAFGIVSLTSSTVTAPSHLSCRDFKRLRSGIFFGAFKSSGGLYTNLLTSSTLLTSIFSLDKSA